MIYWMGNMHKLIASDLNLVELLALSYLRLNHVRLAVLLR